MAMAAATVSCPALEARTFAAEQLLQPNGDGDLSFSENMASSALPAKLLLRVLRHRSCGRSGRVTAKLKALLTNMLWPLGAFEVFTDGSLRHLQKSTEHNISEPQAAASSASHAH